MKINELTRFSITLGLLPWIPSFLLYRHSHVNVAICVIVVFLTLSLLCFISKKFAQSFKHILEKIGRILGDYIAKVTLFIVYICTIIPTGMLMKIVKRDRLHLKKPEVTTYWSDCENHNTDYEYQF